MTTMTIKISTYIAGAVGKITELHGQYYSRHWNFGAYFEIKVAQELAKLVQGMAEKRNNFWVATTENNQIVGGIAIEEYEKNQARLRFFIIDEPFQGLSIGKMLMQTAIDFCKEQGFEQVFLTTFRGLDQAKHLYLKYGFVMANEHLDKNWGAEVYEQEYVLRLV